ncbi:hypothetical protein GCM10028805_64710 [Spirosoma harenae]
MKTLRLLAAILLFPLVSLGQTIYEVKFIAGSTQYRGALVMGDNGTGKMRVRFYKQGVGPVMIEQYMRMENTRYGNRLTGYNPVYPGTTVRYPTYNADNFYISQDEYGNLTMTNIDDRGVTANASIRVFQTTYDKQRFLSDFNWELR